MLTSYRTLRAARGGLLLAAILIVAAVLALAFLLGFRPSVAALALVIGMIGAVLLLLRPSLGPAALVIAALLLPIQLGTGTAVTLNPATLLTPALLVIWLVIRLIEGPLPLAASRANLPLALFLAAGLLSLLAGIATWDPMVVRPAGFLVVQLGQWAIFALSAGAFWLAGNLIRDEAALRRLTALFLAVAGGIAIVRLAPGMQGLGRATTVAFTRAPLWALLVALAGGQLLFNRDLRPRRRIFLAAVLAAGMIHAFVEQRDATSMWVGIGVVSAVLVALRLPRRRWLMLAVVMALIVIGAAFPALYDFAGGDEAWASTGASRLVLIERVIQVAMRSPITGLGPAAYRPYANATPLQYAHIYWVAPRVSSHNNYVDLFAHGGILGLALFAWWAAALAREGLRLRSRCPDGFAAGFVNGMLACGAGALVLMLLADWILPFVYNVGFPGFQASVLVWLFLGGIVALNNLHPGRSTA